MTIFLGKKLYSHKKALQVQWGGGRPCRGRAAAVPAVLGPVGSCSTDVHKDEGARAQFSVGVESCYPRGAAGGSSRP